MIWVALFIVLSALVVVAILQAAKFINTINNNHEEIAKKD